MDSSTFAGDREAAGFEYSSPAGSKRNQGGWITFPFMIVTLASLTLATGGWFSNLVVYLIDKFHMTNIDATQVANIVNGSISLIPVVGAILADSFLGCYTVILISSLISFLGIVLLTLTVTVDSMRPQACNITGGGSRICPNPSKLQYGALYSAITLGCIGSGGSRFTSGTMGADQFSNPKDQATYFNWYFFTMYVASVIASTAIVLVEDTLSWAWGFGICLTANAVGLAIFLLGSPFYKHVKPKSSPFTALARVVVATVRKRNIRPSPNSGNYYHGPTGNSKTTTLAIPTDSFRFLNRAAWKTEGDLKPNGSIANMWKICTVEEVEDLKSLIRIFPLWSSSIFLSTPIGIQASLTILQTLTVDRHLGPHFQVPVGSILVVTFISTSISITLFDIFLLPAWEKFSGKTPTPLQRIGVGHVFNVLAMAISALVEIKRLEMFKSRRENMSVLWLMPQLVAVGVGEAFHFPGQVALYYQEFPASLKGISTAMIALLIAVGFYLSAAVIQFVRKVTGWLPDDINDGKLDNAYWMLVVVGFVNFGYYVLCAWLYTYRRIDDDVNMTEDETSNGNRDKK